MVTIDNYLFRYSLIAILLVTLGSGYRLFGLDYSAIESWRFWFTLLGFLISLFMTLLAIVCWVFRIDSKRKLLLLSVYILGVVLLTGVIIADIIIAQRYDTIIHSAVMIIAATFGVIALLKSGALDKKSDEGKIQEEQEATILSE